MTSILKRANTNIQILLTESVSRRRSEQRHHNEVMGEEPSKVIVVNGKAQQDHIAAQREKAGLREKLKVGMRAPAKKTLPEIEREKSTNRGRGKELSTNAKRSRQRGAETPATERLQRYEIYRMNPKRRQSAIGRRNDE